MFATQAHPEKNPPFPYSLLFGYSLHSILCLVFWKCFMHYTFWIIELTALLLYY